MATRGSSSEFRILALSGGGYLGLYAAVVLAELEARVGEPLARRFDLIVLDPPKFAPTAANLIVFRFFSGLRRHSID